MQMIDELEAAERAATPGPWKIHDDRRKWVTSDDQGVDWTANRDADAAFVVLSRNRLPALLRVARAADEFWDAEMEATAEHVIDPNNEEAERRCWQRIAAARVELDASVTALRALDGTK